MTALAATVAATLFLSEPMPPGCGELRPDITHEYGGPWTVTRRDDDDDAWPLDFGNRDDAAGYADRIAIELCRRMEVRRCTDLGRYGCVLHVVTGKQELTIRVTPSGLIRLDEPIKRRNP